MKLRGERQADFAYQAVYRYMINLIHEVSLETPVSCLPCGNCRPV